MLLPQMADTAEAAFTAFLHDKPVPLTAATPASATSPTTSASSTAAAGPSCVQISTANHNTAAAQDGTQQPKQGASAQGRMAQPGRTAAAKMFDPLPAELTVKHVGFLGSLAHALVHLDKSAEGLALLRAAAHVMRHSPPNYHTLFHHNHPDSKVLHAHVLMDLVSSCAALMSVQLVGSCAALMSVQPVGSCILHFSHIDIRQHTICTCCKVSTLMVDWLAYKHSWTLASSSHACCAIP